MSKTPNGQIVVNGKVIQKVNVESTGIYSEDMGITVARNEDEVNNFKIIIGGPLQSLSINVFMDEKKNFMTSSVTRNHKN